MSTTCHIELGIPRGILNVHAGRLYRLCVRVFQRKTAENIDTNLCQLISIEADARGYRL